MIAILTNPFTCALVVMGIIGGALALAWFADRKGWIDNQL